MVSILRDWFVMLATTRMTKSFKMVLLRVLLDNDAVFSGMPIPELAEKCREFLVAHEFLRRDIADAAPGQPVEMSPRKWESRMRRSPWAFSYSAALVITGEAMFEATRRFASCPSCQPSRPA